MTAIVVGVLITRHEATRKGLPAERIVDAALWVVVGGFIGARVLHVVDRWDYYSANPAQILAVQNGGLAIMGVILGGSLTTAAVARHYRLPLRRLFDAAAPGLVLGQAIGRFGCLFTGDAVGPPTDGTWGVVYANPGAMAPQLGVAYQPTFAYEQLWDVLVFLVIWLSRGRLKADGQTFALYLGLYAIGKFMLTFLRSEVIWFLGLQEAQVFALVAVAVSIAWFAWSKRDSARREGMRGMA
jgi:phosphatidylglycerol:prolipoprotein diacylglycerol transferase